MTERIKALIEKELLEWARRTASLNLAQAAEAAHVPPEKIEAWERGDDGPSIAELKKLAKAYKRPLSVFFLSEIPREFSPLKDFRRLLDGEEQYSRELTYEIRAAQERRQVAIELNDRLGDEMPAWDIRATPQQNPETLARQVRQRLGITLDRQHRWGDPAKAFRAWREAIEGAGVLVSVLGGAHHGVSLQQVRGFALAEQPLPMIVVNGKDRTNGRIFTLMHELAHIVLGVSAIENEMEAGDQIPAPLRSVETFCNRVAAAVLMPQDALQAELLVRAKTPASEWEDNEIAALARRYSVSREALLVRLAELGRAKPSFVRARRHAYAEEYEALVDESEGGFAPYPIQIVSHLGRGFTRLVLQAYANQIVTLSTASGYLGTQAKHVPNIERAAFGAGAH